MTKRRLTVAEAAARDYPDRFEARAAVRRMREILAGSTVKPLERARLQEEVEAVVAYWGTKT